MTATQPGPNPAYAISHEEFKRQFIAEMEQRRPGAAAEIERHAADAGERHRLVAELANRRNRMGLSHAQVAERMGVKPTAVADLEKGAVDPRLSTLQRYARALGGRLVTDIEMPEEQP
jgi:DNA-binding XRE family transcriptional regulator